MFRPFLNFDNVRSVTLYIFVSVCVRILFVYGNVRFCEVDSLVWPLEITFLEVNLFCRGGNATAAQTTCGRTGIVQTGLA